MQGAELSAPISGAGLVRGHPGYAGGPLGAAAGTAADEVEPFLLDPADRPAADAIGFGKRDSAISA